jgi:cobalt-zinc-cadmium resistance protein CzcA
MVKHIKLTLALLPFACLAQTDSLTLDQAVQFALDNNMKAKATKQHVLYQQHLKKASSELPKTDVDFMYGQYNSILKDNSITISQSIPFPTVFSSRNAYNDALVETSKANQRSAENELAYQVKTLCFQVYYLYGKKKILHQQDSLYSVLNNSVSRRYQVGEGNKLELTKTTAQLKEVKNAIHQVNADIEIAESNIQALLNSPSTVHIKDSQDEILTLPILDSANADSNPNVQVMKYQFEAADKLKRVEKA